METKDKTTMIPELKEVFRSDFLPQLMSLLDLVPSLKPLFPRLIQVRLVVDANRVRGELYWRLRKRRDISHRTALHESIVAGVIVPYVPDYLNQEIEDDYEEIATQTRRSVSDVRHEWREFKKHLVFYAPKGRPMAGQIYADADDFPYLAAWRELDAQAIYTTDSHLEKMGAAVISVLIDTRLRDYARSSAVPNGGRIRLVCLHHGWSAISAGVVSPRNETVSQLPTAPSSSTTCHRRRSDGLCPTSEEQGEDEGNMGIVEKLPGDSGRLRCPSGIRHAIREGRRGRKGKLRGTPGRATEETEEFSIAPCSFCLC